PRWPAAGVPVVCLFSALRLLCGVLAWVAVAWVVRAWVVLACVVLGPWPPSVRPVPGFCPSMPPPVQRRHLPARAPRAGPVLLRTTGRSRPPDPSRQHRAASAGICPVARPLPGHPLQVLLPGGPTAVGRCAPLPPR